MRSLCVPCVAFQPSGRHSACLFVEEHNRARLRSRRVIHRPTDGAVCLLNRWGRRLPVQLWVGWKQRETPCAILLKQPTCTQTLIRDTELAAGHALTQRPPRNSCLHNTTCCNAPSPLCPYEWTLHCVLRRFGSAMYLFSNPGG